LPQRRLPGDCVQVVLSNAPILGVSHQTWQLNEISALIWPSPLGIGTMDPDLWDQTIEIATSEEILKAAPEGSAYITDISAEAIANLESQGLDVKGESWQRVEVELLEGGN
jgi:NitT/TauT family transport system substrate-binding protein